MPRERGENVKERELENLVRRSEHVAEFDYKPSACQHSYRMGVLGKNTSVQKGEKGLLDDARYFFFGTD